MVIYGYAFTDAGDSAFVRLEFEGPPDRPAVRLATFGQTPVAFEGVSLAPDSSAIRWHWPGRIHDRCELVRRAEYHWTGVCRSGASERRIALGGGYVPDLGQDLTANHVDLKIVDRAARLLSTETVWNRVDERMCDDDERSGRRSLFCALYRASLEVAGEYLHRRPALRAVREVIFERAADRVTAHTLRDFNNHEATSFEEVRDVLASARERLAGSQRK